jgi:hypothetical protein
VCPPDYGTDLQKLVLAFLSAVKILPAARLLPAITTLRSNLLRLESSLNSDDFDFDRIKPLLKTALADELDDALIWDQVYHTVTESTTPPRQALNPEWASNLDGRQYFLRGLHTVEQKFDRDTWTRMTRDLFHNLDHPLFDVRASFVTFLNDRKKELPERCAKWALPVCVVLRQLATEIRRAVDLVEFRYWNDGILKDALEALRYSIYDFLGPIAMLLRDYCCAKADKKYADKVKIGTSGSLETWGQVGNFCIKCMVDAELALMGLILHLSRGQAMRDGLEKMELADLEPLKVFKGIVATPVANRVPTATFTELVIQNQSIIQRRSIVTTLDGTNLAPATNYICMSFVHFFPARANPLQAMFLSAQKEKRSEYPIAAKAGIPRCLAIVVDRQTGIVTTGATQPAYDTDFPWLDSMG